MVRLSKQVREVDGSLQEQEEFLKKRLLEAERSDGENKEDNN